jgi:hypothetical protein
MFRYHFKASAQVAYVEACDAVIEAKDESYWP